MILVFGTVCLDRVRRVPNLPPPGGYVEADSQDLLLGGEAANTALALQAWNARPVLVSNPLGEDPMGEALRGMVHAKDLDLRELEAPAATQAPVCDVLVTPDGERTMFGTGFRALDGRLDLNALPLASGGLFTADANFARSAGDAADRARAAGMRTYLMDLPETDAGRAPCDFWQASEKDATPARADGLARRTGAFVLLTRGADGLVAGGPGLPARAYPPFPAPRLRDSTGAGDAFRAGMLYGLDRGWAIPGCLQFAAAVGALSVGEAGASGRPPDLAEVAALITAHPQIALAYA